MRLVPTQSSSLAGIAYKPGSTDIYVQFSNGSMYVYDLATTLNFNHLGTAEQVTDILFNETSQGSEFAHSLRKFGGRKLTKEEVEDLNLHV